MGVLRSFSWINSFSFTLKPALLSVVNITGCVADGTRQRSLRGGGYSAWKAEAKAEATRGVWRDGEDGVGGFGDLEGLV